MIRSTRVALVALAAIAVSASAQADVVISSAATQNMSCSAGVCAPTATDAVLNVTDLANMLWENVTVTTTGSGGVQANNIVVSARLAGAWATVLSLDAYKSIVVQSKIGLENRAGGELWMVKGGHVVFKYLLSSLSINGTSYKLVKSIFALAKAIASNPDGAYALSDSYDASGDGTYTSSPISTTFSGVFNGLGNSVSNLTIDSQTHRGNIGLFAVVSTTGSINSLNLDRVSITVTLAGSDVGGMLAENQGSIFNARSSGSLDGGENSKSGGLVGFNTGTVYQSKSTVTVRGGKAAVLGGLVGVSETPGAIGNSFATGKIAGYGPAAEIGGLVGNNSSSIADSYAEGDVKGMRGSYVGGLVGSNDSGSIANSYSIGSVGAKSGNVGGFAGGNLSGIFQDCYWDTDTSGTDEGTGAGSSNGLTGLTTEEFQSGLPAGFDPSIWAQDPKINGNYPYLINNPPMK